jgi:hypothetical protein
LAASELEKLQEYLELKAALDGLSYQSESDHPLDFVCWQKQAGKSFDSQFVCEQLGQSPTVRVEEVDPQAFLDDCSKIESWFGDDEKKSAEGFKKLQELLNQQLKGLKLFRLGEIEVTIAVVGEDDNNVVGFKTISIET